MAPLLATVAAQLLAANLPKVAQAVLDKGLDYVSGKLGIELKPDMTPEQMAQVREQALKHEEFMVQQANANTADARAMQIAALAQTDVLTKRFVIYFAIFWSLFAASYIGWITFGKIPADNVRFADTILGFLLGTIVSTILNFFYGSSAGSREKTEILRGRNEG